MLISRTLLAESWSRNAIWSRPYGKWRRSALYYNLALSPTSSHPNSTRETIPAIAAVPLYGMWNFNHTGNAYLRASRMESTRKDFPRAPRTSSHQAVKEIFQFSTRIFYPVPRMVAHYRTTLLYQYMKLPRRTKSLPPVEMLLQELRLIEKRSGASGVGITSRRPAIDVHLTSLRRILRMETTRPKAISLRCFSILGPLHSLPAEVGAQASSTALDNILSPRAVNRFYGRQTPSPPWI